MIVSPDAEAPGPGRSGVASSPTTLRSESGDASPREEQKSRLSPTTYGERYLLREPLGVGGMGQVLDCHDRRVGRDVALKLLQDRYAELDELSLRFELEAKIQARLEHPGVVPVYDIGVREDGAVYFTMKRVHGLTLEQIVARLSIGGEDISKKYSRRRLLTAFSSLCLAVAYGHSRGVVHRDLKPGNVILEGVAGDEEGLDGARVRVLDFGMAKLIHGSASASITALTEQNMVFGTPEYMAPEQARGDDVDARSDIYSAGVLLYELISGKLPFRGNTPIGIMTAHLTEEPAPPSSHAPERQIPPALESVVLHAMAKQPEARYPSARHLREALERALTSPDDTQSIAPPSKDDLSLTDTQHDMKLPDGLSRTEVDVAAVTLDPRPEADAERGNSRLWLLVAIVAALLGIAAGVAVSLGTS